METPQMPLTVHGWTRLTSDNGRIQIHLFREVSTGLITTGLVEFRADNGTVWGPLREVRPVV